MISDKWCFDIDFNLVYFLDLKIIDLPNPIKSITFGLNGNAIHVKRLLPNQPTKQVHFSLWAPWILFLFSDRGPLTFFLINKWLDGPYVRLYLLLLGAYSCLAQSNPSNPALRTPTCTCETQASWVFCFQNQTFLLEACMFLKQFLGIFFHFESVCLDW